MNLGRPLSGGYGVRVREIHDVAELRAALASGESLRGLRLQGVDLEPVAHELVQRRDLAGLAVLGGHFPPTLGRHLREHGAVLFPDHPAAPVDPYRSTLYSVEELYDGLREHGYDATPDAIAYHWSKDGALAHDALVTLLRAIHDDAITDALHEVVIDAPTVGVMGGHALQRGSDGYAHAARLVARLAEAGHVVITGGGPGAMEAANLGALVGARLGANSPLLDDALGRLAAVPSFIPSIQDWALSAFDVRADVLAAALGEGRQPPDGGLSSIGVPTWFYGHEPPNVFCDGVAKYFSNAVREDELLAGAQQAVVVLPGAAGTVQEVFQFCTRLYYAAPGRPLPRLVLVGTEHWESRLPVWPLVRAMARDRLMEHAVVLVDTVDDAVSQVLG